MIGLSSAYRGHGLIACTRHVQIPHVPPCTGRRNVFELTQAPRPLREAANGSRPLYLAKTDSELVPATGRINNVTLWAKCMHHLPCIIAFAMSCIEDATLSNHQRDKISEVILFWLLVWTVHAHLSALCENQALGPASH